MSAAAIRTGMSAASTAAPPTVTHAHAAQSPLDAIFRTILDGVDSHDVASQATARGASGSSSNRAGSSNANPASAMASFEASLVTFDCVGLSDASIASASPRPTTRSSTAGARAPLASSVRDRVTDTVAAPIDVVAALAAAVAAAVAAPSSATAANTPPAGAASTSAAKSDLNAVAPLVLRAGEEFGPALPSQAVVDEASAANWDLSGATPLNTLLMSDASLGFDKLQAKTHLAVAGSATVKASASSASNSAASVTNTVGSAVVYAQDAVSVATSGGGATGGGNSAANRSSRGAGDAPDNANPIIAAVSIDAADPTVAGAAGVPLPQLADLIANETQTLASSTSAASDAKIDAQPMAGSAKVKELEINLDPADLGKMSLKLRLSGGKLSVSIGVADPQTLSAIENERSAIESRLMAQQQPLDSLVIQSQEASANDAGTYGSSAFNGFGGNAQSGSGSAPSHGSSQESANANPGASGGGPGGLDDMVV